MLKDYINTNLINKRMSWSDLADVFPLINEQTKDEDISLADFLKVVEFFDGSKVLRKSLGLYSQETIDLVNEMLKRAKSND